MKTSSLIAVVAAASMLTACQQGGPPGSGVMSGGGLNKQDVGTVAGAIGGGVIGSTMGGGAGKTAAIIGGSLLGGMLGNTIGASLDNADRAAYNAASQRAMETAQPGQTLPWRNPHTGNSGTITPSNYYQNSQGQYCREYNQTIVVGGQKQSGYGKACRQPDGTWQIIE
jgi:surface antigen